MFEKESTDELSAQIKTKLDELIAVMNKADKAGIKVNFDIRRDKPNKLGTFSAKCTITRDM